MLMMNIVHQPYMLTWSHSHMLTHAQADVLTQIERLYSEFQSHSAERARTHEFPLVRTIMYMMNENVQDKTVTLAKLVIQ